MLRVMSEAAVEAPIPIPFEQRIFQLSPLGTLGTSFVIFTILFGSFLVIATAEHVSTFMRSGIASGFSNAAWPAMVLSLLCTTALGMQRYARLAEAKDTAGYAKILTGGMSSALDVTAIAPSRARLARATLIGLVLGIAISIAIRLSENREGHIIPAGMMLWYAAATSLLTVLFVRGVEQSNAGNRSYEIMLHSELKIDLLRTDTLAVLGRSAFRSALIWFVVSAVACLFFVGGDLNWLTIGLIIACAAMGLILFVRVMSRIHRQIKGAKDRELEHVRRQIDEVRATLASDAASATRIQGLLAYEKRIEDAHEWPFDQTTLVRLGASTLIVTMPWFGQAVAGYVIDHLAH